MAAIYCSVAVSCAACVVGVGPAAVVSVAKQEVLANVEPLAGPEMVELVGAGCCSASRFRLRAMGGMVASNLCSVTAEWRQKMQPERLARPALKHLSCGYCLPETTDRKAHVRMAFQPSPLLFELIGLKIGSKLAPSSGKDGWAAARFLHRHRLTAASVCLATTTVVSREAEDSAIVGDELGCTVDRPTEPLQGAYQSRRWAVDDPP